MRFVGLILTLFLVGACTNKPANSGGSSSSSLSELAVIIENYQFNPATIEAAPGDTVFFENDDGVAHRILSESAAGAFDDTGLFDSTTILDGIIRSITIPDDAVPGTSLFYYCDYLQDTMITPDGEIRVVEPE